MFLNVRVPPNPHVEALPRSGMVFAGGFLSRVRWSHESGALDSGIKEEDLWWHSKLAATSKPGEEASEWNQHCRHRDFLTSVLQNHEK